MISKSAQNLGRNFAGDNWDNLIKVYVKTSYSMNQFEISNHSYMKNDSWVNHLTDQKIELKMENDEIYKTYCYNGTVYNQHDDIIEVVSEIVEPIKKIVTKDKKNMCYISYGEKGSGKSTLLGTLPSFSDNEDNVCFYTLVTLFNQIELERLSGREACLSITAFEIFVDQIIDLTNDSIKENRLDLNSVNVYTISDAVDLLKSIFSKRNHFMEHPDGSSFEICSSLSTLVIELSLQNQK